MMDDCLYCGLPGEHAGVDLISHFGGSFGTLCDFCDDVNDMLWDIASVRKIVPAL